MSYFDDASLVMIPSGYKTDKVYSVKPTSGGGDLAFTRSNDTATRVASNGLIERVRTNLALQSEAFNTTWAVNGIAVTANTAANPLTGTTTADTITADAANNFHLINQSITYAAGEATVSVYVKANGYTWFVIDPSTTNAFGYYNITTGTVGIKGSACTTSITNVGGGWYRCSVTFTATAGAAFCSFSIRNADNGGAFLGDGVSGFFIYGAQVETGVATDYIATTTAAVSVGPVANVPRLDYLNSSCPRLLLEPQRTNLAQYSEQFDNAYWVKSNATITANTTVSPDGTQSADTAVITAGGYIYAEFFPYAAVTGQSATLSVFAKNASGELVFFGGATTAGTDVYKIENYGNGWYRHSRVRTFTATASTTLQYIISSVGTYIIWGAQVEGSNSAYATSYIPTLGAAVTRGADAASKTGIASLIGQTEGTIFLDVNLDSRVSFTYFALAPSLGSTANYIGIAFTATSIDYEVIAGGAAQATLGTANSTTGRFKIAATYKANDFSLYINGIQIGTDTSGTVPTCSEIGLYQFSQAQSLKYNQALLFKTRLTNAQLAELTTI